MKKLVSLFVCVLLTLSLCACGSGTKREVVLSDVLDSINTEFSISAEEMLLIEDIDTLELYYNIAPSDVKQFAVETTLNSATDITEIILIEAVDDSACDRVYEALNIRYNSQRDLCASYSTELLAIINRCSIQRNDNYLCLIISDDFDNMLAHYNSFFK